MARGRHLNISRSYKATYNCRANMPLIKHNQTPYTRSNKVTDINIIFYQVSRVLKIVSVFMFVWVCNDLEFVCRLFYASLCLTRDWPVVCSGGNGSTRRKPPPNPKVTGNFLTCPGRDSNTGSGERQRTVSGGALDHRTIRLKTHLIIFNNPIL